MAVAETRDHDATFPEATEYCGCGLLDLVSFAVGTHPSSWPVSPRRQTDNDRVLSCYVFC